jgi:hypothetical protein
MSTRRPKAQLPPRHTALGEPSQSQNGGRFVLSWKPPRPKRTIGYQAQSVEKELVPWMVETFSGAETAATFIRLSDDLRNGLSSTAVSLLLQR